MTTMYAQLDNVQTTKRKLSTLVRHNVLSIGIAKCNYHIHKCSPAHVSIVSRDKLPKAPTYS